MVNCWRCHKKIPEDVIQQTCFECWDELTEQIQK